MVMNKTQSTEVSWAGEGQLWSWSVGVAGCLCRRGAGEAEWQRVICAAHESLLVFPLAAWGCSEFQEGVRYARGRHLKYNKT